MKEFDYILTNKGVVLCEKDEGAFMCLSYVEEIDDLLSVILSIKNSKNEEEQGTPIDELRLHPSYEGALRSDGIKTIEELKRYSGVDLLKIPNFGKKALHAVRECLDDFDKRKNDN